MRNKKFLDETNASRMKARAASTGVLRLPALAERLLERRTIRRGVD